MNTGINFGDGTPAIPPSPLAEQQGSLAERIAAGKSLRKVVPFESHAEFLLRPGRRDPVDILEEQARTRLPFLVPLRYARMSTSAFAFLRGSAAVMAADLAHTPVTGIPVQACGDMHVANFGVFASAERNLVFGINDFDETLPGYWEWDLKRLVASAVVAVRFLGGDAALARAAALAAARSYRKQMRRYAAMRYLDVWYARMDEKGILASFTPEGRKAVMKVIAKARQRGHMQVLGKMTELVDDRHRIIESAPLIVREQTTEDGRPVLEVLDMVMRHYMDSLPEERRALFSRYRVVDVARKVVGVGSVGTRCWVLLLEGNGADDPLFLQFKEAQASVLAPYMASPAWDCEGRRVVVGQRIIQGAPDIFLGYGKFGDRHFYMRQLRDMKGGPSFDPATTVIRNAPDYCKLCGWALALAHAKSGDAALIAGYLGRSTAMDEALADFAEAYADQTERDHAALLQAVREGRIRVSEAQA